MESTHDSKSRISAELLDRYITGMCDEAERARVAAWMAEAPHRTLRDGFRLGLDVQPDEIALALGRVRRGIETPSGGEFQMESSQARTSRVAGLGSQPLREGIAGLRTRTLRHAIVASVLGIGVLSLVMFGRARLDRTRMTRTYVTVAGQQANLTLDDGSQILLAPSTTLRMVNFGARTRVVELGGEAYFTVTHAGTIPFIVQSGGVMTRVLGTTFLIRHPVGSTQVHVAVNDGRVRMTPVSKSGNGVTLHAGQVGDVTDSTVRTSSLEDASAGEAWDAGQLVFRHIPVAIVLQKLSRWYGYQFRCADRMLEQQYVTVGISTKSSAEALAELEEVLAVNLTIVGDTVTLVPRQEAPLHGAPRVRTYDVWTPAREVGR